MRRRNFLKLAAASGVAVLEPRGLRHAHALEGGGRRGPFWLFVQAQGGWDPLLLCDPKPGPGRHQGSPGWYDEVGSAGSIKYAPLARNRKFFDRHFQRTPVINGLNTESILHDVGARHVLSGKLTEGYPSLPAILAAGQITGKLGGFVSFGA